MSDTLRYKIVLWVLLVQIALLPIVIVMISVTNSGVMWRWNLINNLLVGGYILGLLALPVSRGLKVYSRNIDGSANISLSPGAYIVKAGDVVKKVLIK